MPSVSGGVLWPDSTNKLFYLFGGEYDNTNAVQSFTTLWLYDIMYNTWNRSSASDGSLTGINWPALGAGTFTDVGVAYYYGGYLTNLSMPKWPGDRLMLNSLISFNMNTRSWQNNTYDQTPRAEGSMHFIPASDAGMLVYFGGVEMDNGTSSYVSPILTSEMVIANISQANMSVSCLRGIASAPLLIIAIEHSAFRHSEQPVVHSNCDGRCPIAKTRRLRQRDLGQR